LTFSGRYLLPNSRLPVRGNSQGHFPKLLKYNNLGTIERGWHGLG
jgi:hypothetical protein